MLSRFQVTNYSLVDKVILRILKVNKVSHDFKIYFFQKKKDTATKVTWQLWVFATKNKKMI